MDPNHEMAWRTPLARQIVFILLIGFDINFFPDSARWPMKMGRKEETRAVLKATRETDVEYELKGIKKVVKYQLETSGANHYAVMLFLKDRYSRHLRWRVFLVVGWFIDNGSIITMITPFLFQAINYDILLLLFGLNIFCIPFCDLVVSGYGREEPGADGYVFRAQGQFECFRGK